MCSFDRLKASDVKMNELTEIHENHLLAGQTMRYTYIERNARKIRREKLCEKILINSNLS